MLTESKHALASKLNWLGILTFVAGLTDVAQYLPVEVRRWLLLLIGVAVVALRTFFTSQPISGVRPDDSKGN